MLNLVRREPCMFGHERSRWTLSMLLDSCDEIGLIPRERLHSLPGLHQLLERLGISYKRARSHLYSPDPFYMDKQAEVERLITQAKDSAGIHGPGDYLSPTYPSTSLRREGPLPTTGRALLPLRHPHSHRCQHGALHRPGGLPESFSDWTEPVGRVLPEAAPLLS